MKISYSKLIKIRDSAGYLSNDFLSACAEHAETSPDLVFKAYFSKFKKTYHLSSDTVPIGGAVYEELRQRFFKEILNHKRLVALIECPVDGVTPLHELGDQIGLTKERARQIERNALRHIAKVMKRTFKASDLMEA